jgi:diguanylate cyclase (GGDEF)-like protein/PAS domain S-box-containing protein
MYRLMDDVSLPAWSPRRRAVAAALVAAMIVSLGMLAVGASAAARLVAAAGVIVVAVGGALLVHATSRDQRRAVRHARAAEARLRDSESRYRGLMAHVPVGVFLADAAGELLYVNETWSEITGLAPGHALGRGWLQAVHPDDRERVSAAWYVTTGAQTEYRGEMRIGDPEAGDAVRHVLVRTERADDIGYGEGEGEGGEGFIGTVVDVSERRRAEELLRDSERRHRLISANLPGSVVAILDHDLRITLLEGEIAESAYDADALVCEPVTVLGGPEDAEALSAAARAALRGLDATVELDSDRLGRILEIQLGPYRDELGEILGVLLVGTDVTTQRLADAALRHAERRFRAVFEEAPIGMAVVDLDGKVRQANRALADITGYRRSELESTALHTITHPDDLDIGDEALAALADGHAEAQEAELRYLHSTGHPVWVSMQATLVRDADDEPDFLIVQVQDVTERRRFEDRLRHMADHDPLTGLPNRRAFEAALEGQVEHVQRYGPAGALLVLDLDGFKYVNDTLGHSAGDELLVSVAAVLRERLRATDVLARLGGDEFAILLPQGGRDEAWTVAQALVESIRNRADRLRGELAGRITASVGVALFTDAEISSEEMFVNADLAMYDAKEAGRNRVCFFSDEEEAESKIKARMEWVEKIVRALDEDRFTLHAQPIVDLQKMEVSWHELLIRMVDEEGELVPPGAFLYVAERFDLIQSIDRMVVRKAIDHMEAEGRQGRRLPVSVNVSGRSLGDPELLEIIEEDLARAKHVNPHDLVLEVTETAAVSDIPAARLFSERLSELGCRLALDDFGAGFGSFYYLKHLPFDVLKIDGEFVRGCATNPTDRLVIKALVDIARGMGKVTVAEFVGDDEIVRLLLREGVDLGQGYHLGKPRPLEELLGPYPLEAPADADAKSRKAA